MVFAVGGVMLPLPCVRVGVMLRVPRPPLRAALLTPRPPGGGVMLRLAAPLLEGGVRLRLPRSISTSMVLLRVEEIGWMLAF